MRNHSWAWRRGVMVGAVALMLALPTGGFARQGGPDQPAKSAQAGRGSATAGTRATVQWQAKPPTRTAEQRRRLEAAEAKTNRPGPAVSQAGTPQTKRHGPEVPAPDTSTANKQSTILAGPPGTLNIFRDSFIPGAQVSNSGFADVSNTQEPSIGVNGKYNFQAGNWYATRSINNGATWQYLDPYVTFGPNFCCDQVVIYEPSRNLMFWLLMGVEDPGTTGNHLLLAVSAGNDLASWCTYPIDTAWFGEPSTTFLDYQDMAFSNDFLYITSNPFPAAGGNKTAIVRMPLDELRTCSGFTYNFLNVADWFNFKPVQGATETMYWASVTPLTPAAVLGSSIRIYSWAENSGTIFIFDRTIPAFAYMNRNAGQNCASQNGMVNNWCNYADSRSLGAYLARGVIAFSFNAKQDATHPYPYTRLVRFLEGSKNYLNSTDFMASAFSLLFMSWSPNARGHLASTFAWGGGTGGNTWFPGSGMMIQDDFGSSFRYLSGHSNACPSNGITARWGDYLTVRPFYPAAHTWIAVGMRNINGGPCAGGYSEVRNFLFGRERDANSYHRWKNT